MFHRVRSRTNGRIAKTVQLVLNGQMKSCVQIKKCVSATRSEGPGFKTSFLCGARLQSFHSLCYYYYFFNSRCQVFLKAIWAGRRAELEIKIQIGVNVSVNVFVQ